MARMIVYPDPTPAGKVGEASTDIKPSDEVGRPEVFTMPFGSTVGPRVSVVDLPDPKPEPEVPPEPAAVQERRPGRPRLPRDADGRIIRP